MKQRIWPPSLYQYVLSMFSTVLCFDDSTAQKNQNAKA